MTPKSDETIYSGTLPRPELNPLLNPVLNKNLGRWAEVYFTNPPERRDEAVLNLLRELESGDQTPEKRPRPSLQRTTLQRRNEARNYGAICRQCGFDNGVQQKFCGDCGALLSPVPTTTEAGFSSAQPPRAKLAGPAPPLPKDRVDEAIPQFGSILHLSDTATSRADPQFTDRGSVLHLSGVPASEELESASLKSPYRVLIGTVLVLIIGGLLYVAWRSGQFNPQHSKFPAQAPSAATQAVNPAPGTASPATPMPGSEVASQTSALAPGASAPAAIPDAKHGQAAKPVSASSTETAATAKNSSATSANGSQELTTALGFLNGVGQERDSSQAAQWLWKAVEKKNTAADVLLAGLYLRGDGVQKNCDQGRILLDAAADKGSKDAANLLRNLQAFGCE